MKLFIFVTVVVLGLATAEDQKELAQRIVDTEAECTSINILKGWNWPQGNIYNALATICNDYLEAVKQRYVKQFNVNLDQSAGTTFVVLTNEGERQVTKPAKQSIDFNQGAAMSQAVGLSQEIVNQHVICDQLEQKKEGGVETCNDKLNCMKKMYMEEKQYTYSTHPIAFLIEYKGTYTPIPTPPKDTECRANVKRRRKRTSDNAEGIERPQTRRRRSPEYPENREESRTRRRRTTDYQENREQSRTRRRRAPVYPENREGSKYRRRRNPEYEENPMTRRRRSTNNAENRGQAKSRTKRTSDDTGKTSAEVFPSFTDKWKSRINSPQLKKLYKETKKIYERRPKGDSRSELRRNLAIGIKSLIHAANLYRHSYDPLTDEIGVLEDLEVEFVDWVTAKLVDMTIKKTLGNN